MSGENRYLEYLKAVARPFKKIAKLEFLQPDNSVAFSVGSIERKRGYMTKYDTRAFIQGGTLNVSTNNGARRSATVTLSNLDGAFEYAVNKIWFGQRVRLSMGLILPDDTEFYLPQGVFYIKNPQTVYKPDLKQVTFQLVDKWAMLDGSLGGRLPNTYIIKTKGDNGKRNNAFDAIKGLLQRSKYDLEITTDPLKMIDNVTPVFANYYIGKEYEYKQSDGTIVENINATDIPYDIQENLGGTLANLILSINQTFVGQCGYDCTGAFRIEPSQEDIDDKSKPVLWSFSPRNCNLVGITETTRNTEVYNDVLITGESTTNAEVWGRAQNFDPSSDTNINLIGIKTFTESKAEYWNAKQCVDLARWYLKKKTVLQKSITIECSQMFHLIENRLITVERTDKKGKPVERHLINSFSIPIGETGSMTISATSVNDFPGITVENSYTYVPPDEEELSYQEVEYIESTGTQYIDTGIKTSNSLSFEIRTNYANGTLLGAQDNSNAEKCIAIAGSSNSEYVRFLSDSAGQFLGIPVNTYGFYDLTIKAGKATLTYNNKPTDISLTTKNNTIDLPIYIFARNVDGAASGYSPRKLFYFKVYDNGTLVRDFIPVYRKSDGAIGLYDLVGKSFYANAGTGTFLKGAEIV